MNTDIIGNINEVLNKIIKSIDKDIFSLMDKLITISPKIFSDTILSKKELINSIYIFANSLIVGFLLYYAVSSLLAAYSGKEVIGIGRYIFKIIICTILLNNSMFICQQIVNLIYLVNQTISSIGKEIFSQDISFVSLYKKLNDISSIKDADYLTLDGIIKGMTSFGAISLLISYAIRYVQIQLLILVSPIVILCVVSGATYGIFKGWLKMFLSLLFLQFFINFIILIAIGIKGESEIFNKIIFIGCMYSLYKANELCKEFISYIGAYSDISSGINNIKGGVR